MSEEKVTIAYYDTVPLRVIKVGDILKYKDEDSEVVSIDSYGVKLKNGYQVIDDYYQRRSFEEDDDEGLLTFD
jgi:hypothetical protein